MELAKLDVFACIETLRSYVDRLDFKSYRIAHKPRLTARHRKINAGGGAMVWRCFWGEDFGPLEIIDTSSVDQETYINILANRFHPWLANVTVYQERGFIFREDGDSCHTGGYARWWKETHQIKGFGYWPAQSPDLSPIEHVWNALERRIERKRSPVKKLEQLKVALREEWERIDDEFAYRLVRSMKRRCETVIKA
ncbi:hypothetical protein RO3G_14467 [Rhizopus delemar RA 99-880]|uniref:Tc1-like transposase DDE domain-containing protein n=1 Tax=Rhizopus delemar (strain RA 99-880 / ATCC MYA-4621 / FGSC 9543 / NRRL 43880) TaxID=246409 RepID=I1CMS6_RHIO9|nr:hypothetical protein RO3G_14467 [Rhizopus delemar RA 99-880]|eukprot:EIE89756.1 hypothetical protein RO3G_14467 [Rhizopus delemar RA 99-880]